MKKNQLIRESNYSDWKKLLNKQLIREIENTNPIGVRFYNYKNNEAIICLIASDEGLGCGVSLKSPDDEFSEKFGRNRAAGRAVKAIKTKAVSEKIRDSLDDIPNNWTKKKIDRILFLSSIFAYKSIYSYVPKKESKIMLDTFVLEFNENTSLY